MTSTSISHSEVSTCDLSDPFPKNIEFQMKNGGTKSILRTDKLLGEGGQGKVYLGVDEQGNNYAIKITDLTKYLPKERPGRLKEYE